MPESASHDIHVLHGLMSALRDSLKALEAAATREPALAEALRARMAERQGAAAELEAQAARLGGRAEPAGGLLEAAQHALSALIPGASPETTPTAEIAGLGREEAQLKARFDAAMKDQRLSGPVRDAVIRIYDPVKAGQDALLELQLRRDGET